MKKVRIKKANNGLKVNGGFTPLSPDTVMLNGKSHSKGGQDISYNGIPIEAEGGEPVAIHGDGSATVYGNMIVPGTKKKFKSLAASLSRKQTKSMDLASEGLNLVNNNSPLGTKWEALKFNSGKVMLSGGRAKYNELTSIKEHLSDLQETILTTANDNNLDADAFAKGVLKRAKLGAKINAQNGAKWKYNNTRTEGLDDKIKGFVALLESKGLTGYSGPESGVSQRNTKSGRKSRHASGQALDAFLNTPDAYAKVLNDKDLSKYLIDNGLTVLNEYDPNVKEKTGATAGHLHIGYDTGTPISEQFRNDAANLYKASNPNWSWSKRVGPSGKPLKGVQSGDNQFDFTNIPFKNIPYTGKPGTEKANTVNATYPNSFNFSTPQPRPIPTDVENLELSQVLPELYSLATNRTEPVHLQQYTPELYQPYQVSFQDRLNRNQGTFSGVAQQLRNNPSALSTLAGQKYEADNQVLADEFRTNQGIANDITNKNTALLNEAELKNLQLADVQYTRQAKAKSNTKDNTFAALNSISNKLLQRKAENRNLKVYENLYDFRFDQDTGRAEYMGTPGNELLRFPEGQTAGSTAANPMQLSQDQSVAQRYDKNGNLVYSTVSTPSQIKSVKDRMSINRQFKFGKTPSFGELMNWKYAGNY
jgi:hypothetical protein